MIVAALGDVHGRMAAAIETLRQAERDAGVLIDIVLQVGDFEPHRDADDLAGMYAPHRKKEVGEFGAYARGEKRFPWPLFFIGGNHEPYAYLRTASSGCRVADNIEFLGFAGLRRIHGLELAFLSGIYDERHTTCRPVPPGPIGDADVDQQRALSCFTIHDLEQLRCVKRPHVLMFHEWPRGLVRPHDHEQGQPRHRRLRWGETGVGRLRALVEEIEADVVLCGHVHRAYRGVIEGPHGVRTDVHCLPRADQANGCTLFTFDGARLSMIRSESETPSGFPDQDVVNQALTLIDYPSTHQYTIDGGRMCPAASALPRLSEIASLLPDRQWRSLIDIGCGKGMFLLWAWRHFGLQRLVGIDDAEPMVTAARLAAEHLGAPAAILHGPPSEFEAALSPADLVFVFHCYHYLFLGSASGSPGIDSHDSWFDFFARITTDTLLFANPLELTPKQVEEFRDRGVTVDALSRYRPDAIMAAARRHFDVTPHSLGGGRPYLVMTRRASR